MVQFSRWQFLESAEVALEKRLKRNPRYPFKYLCSDPNGNSVYVYSERAVFFYISLMGCAATAVGLTIWVLAGGDKEFTLYWLLGFLLCGYFSIEHHGVHSIVLEPSSREYSTYSKRILTSNQPFHNIYLRLQQRMTGFRQNKYYLVINGWGFEAPIIVSGLTQNKAKLRYLAQQITQELDLNYFDLADVSSLHIIKHHRNNMKLKSSLKKPPNQRLRKVVNLSDPKSGSPSPSFN